MKQKAKFSLNKVKKLLPANWVTLFCDADDSKQTIFEGWPNLKYSQFTIYTSYEFGVSWD